MHRWVIIITILVAGCATPPPPPTPKPIPGYAAAYPPLESVLSPLYPEPGSGYNNLAAQVGAIQLRQGDMAVCR